MADIGHNSYEYGLARAKYLFLSFAGVWVCFLFAAAARPQSAEDRRVTPIVAHKQLALVIGNASYRNRPLANSVNDAQAMAERLRQLGFDVSLVTNADRKTMGRAVDQFVDKLGSGDVAFFYYSGHGMQVDGENYLVPVDFAGQSETDVRYDAHPAGRIQERMEKSGAQLNILVLDACRDNPYRSAARSGSGGLAAMSPSRGTFIAFATAPGHTASDNPGGRNGLFTQYLLEALAAPGLSLNDVFDLVREKVDSASGGKQLPWTLSSVVGRFKFLPAGANTPGPAPTGAPHRVDAAQEAWDMVKNSSNPDDMDDFVRQFPASELAAVAKLRASQLRRAAMPTTATRGQQSLPEVMHWCRSNCSTLMLKNGRYIVTTRNGFESRDFSSIWVVESFTPESVILHRTDTGSFALSETVTGQISGDTLINLKVDGHASNARLAWGAALNTVPGSNAERDRRR